MKNLLCIAAALACGGSALAGAPINGADFAAKYGSPLWSQTIGTQFGNNTDASIDFANGSEIDALYASVSGGFLHIGVAGNLETNFNKLNIVLDYASGGQNTLSGLANLGNLDGLTMDSGFEADAVLSFTSGNDPIEWYVDGSLADGTGGFLGGGAAAGPLMVQLGGADISFAQDNSNVGGVANLGEPNTSDPATVTTGIEIVIDLAAMGWDGSSDILLAGWVNGSGNDFLSNQVIGGLADGTGNLGAPSGIDFNQFDGEQFVRLTIPTPGTVGLVGLAGFAAVRRRRA
ncbi:MAG: hypothetical protein ACIAQF_13675 [Phycisphaerales bacterium JB065]